MSTLKSELHLSEVLYQEMKACANRVLNKGSSQHTMQATEMVNEVCIRLIESDNKYENKAHVFRYAAKAMRNLMIDYARAKSAKKREGQRVSTVWLDSLLSSNSDECAGLLTIDRTLAELAEISERLETITELHYFAGLPQVQIAEILSISTATVERELKFARSFLTDNLLTQQN